MYRLVHRSLAKAGRPISADPDNEGAVIALADLRQVIGGLCMTRIMIAAAFLAASSVAFVAPAAARNYDCSKPGNASKAICKSGAKAPAQSAAKSAPAKVSATSRTSSPSASSTGNAPARNYDCSKPGNKSKAVCKVAATPARSAAAAKPAPAPAARPAPKTAATDDRNPAGATALCKDGTYSHSKVHSGSCSRHGGVSKWI